MARRQGRYWMLTIAHAHFVPWLPPGVAWIRGQLELAEGGFLHWQLLVVFSEKKSLAAVRGVFGDHHAELTRSDRSEDYVWKEDTRVAGTQFELGVKPFRRNNPTDWVQVRDLARVGDLSSDHIPADVYIRCYNQLRQIRQDHLRPVAIERRVSVFWGPTGTGKSRRAWEEATLDAFPKDPRTKFWDGYRDHEHVVMDEFRGSIDISHLLRWFDRYPVIVEIKGSSCVLRATRFWITSNVPPREWYPDLDPLTLEALLRRIEIVHFDAL